MSYYTDPYARPPPGYDRPYEQPPYDRSPYSAPAPAAALPPDPPPPLPTGWHQEWEPSLRRAFWVEDATGRAQWEPPYGPPPGEGYGYFAPPAGSPAGAYEDRGGGYGEEEKSSNAGKYVAAGVAGLAVGGIAGAVVEHEIGELFFCSFLCFSICYCFLFSVSLDGLEVEGVL